MAQRRYNIRVSEEMASKIDIFCIESGLYENASEYFRDVMRQDLERREQESLRKIGEMLEPLLGQPLDDCKPFEPEKDMEEMTKSYLARKEAQEK